MNKTLDADAHRRLAVVRYLYSLAIRQSRQPEPLRGLSLLMFHDALELFFDVALTVGQVKRPDFTPFDWYLKALKGLLPPEETVPERAGLERLNKARASLKHDGRLPAALDIEAYRATTTSFFQQVMPPLFGIEFDDVSMVDLVANEEAKTWMRQAQEHVAANALAEAALKLEAAFRTIVVDFETKCSEKFGARYFGSLQPISSGWGQEEDLNRALATLSRTVQELQHDIRMLSSGVDMRRHRRFAAIAERGRFHKSTVRTEDVHFCREFVVETALTLQQFLGELEAEV